MYVLIMRTYTHVRDVMSFGGTDPSVGTKNFLKREEYFDYEQNVRYFIIFLIADDVAQATYSLNARNYNYLVVCCQMQ